ncbi:MAG: penicillin acylase family protein, partial [Pseudomonadota bacterium]
MAGVWRWTKRGLLGLILLALAALLGAYLLLSRSLPDYTGAYPVRGPKAEIELLRDVRAVPHIYAKTEYDAYFGLGFAHAQ